MDSPSLQATIRFRMRGNPSNIFLLRNVSARRFCVLSLTRMAGNVGRLASATGAQQPCLCNSRAEQQAAIPWPRTRMNRSVIVQHISSLLVVHFTSHHKFRLHSNASLPRFLPSVRLDESRCCVSLEPWWVASLLRWAHLALRVVPGGPHFRFRDFPRHREGRHRVFPTGGYSPLNPSALSRCKRKVA